MTIKILIDENLSRPLAEGLNSLQKPLNNSDLTVEVLSMFDEFGAGTKDEDWIPSWGKKNGIFISQDIHILKNKSQLDLLMKYNLGAFILRPPKGSRHWSKVKILINKWEAIIEAIQKNKKPFAFEVTERAGLKKLSIK